jgi:hypothetical protein
MSRVIIKSDEFYLRELTISDNSFLFELNRDFDYIKYTGDVPFNSIVEGCQLIVDYSN